MLQYIYIDFYTYPALTNGLKIFNVFLTECLILFFDFRFFKHKTTRIKNTLMNDFQIKVFVLLKHGKDELFVMSYYVFNRQSQRHGVTIY